MPTFPRCRSIYPSSSGPSRSSNYGRQNIENLSGQGKLEKSRESDDDETPRAGDRRLDERPFGGDHAAPPRLAFRSVPSRRNAPLPPHRAARPATHTVPPHQSSYP